MNDNELDELIRTTAPVTDAQLASVNLDEPLAALADGIVEGAHRSANRRARLRRPVISVAASVAVLAGVFAVQTNGGGGPAYAAEVVAVAESAPRMLVGADGWRLTRADEFTTDMGEVTFERGAQRFDLHWMPAASASPDKLADESDINERVDVLGHDAVIYRYAETDDYTAWWTAGDDAVNARGVFKSLDAFKAILASLRGVSVNEWLDAMPASVITPSNRADVVDQMLIGVTVPPGFDVERLRAGTTVKDRYQLGAAVSAALACGWIENWIAATGAGDVEAAKAAVKAMHGSHDWPVLNEMNAEGAYPEVLWELADAMAAEQNGTRPNISTEMKNARVRDVYRDSLGCGQ
ncbi:MAG: hypothetical protein QOF21_2788 [Actinomycetota bacterium]